MNSSPAYPHVLIYDDLRAFAPTVEHEYCVRIRHLDDNAITTLPGTLFANTLGMREL